VFNDHILSHDQHQKKIDHSLKPSGSHKYTLKKIASGCCATMLSYCLLLKNSKIVLRISHSLGVFEVIYNTTTLITYRTIAATISKLPLLIAPPQFTMTGTTYHLEHASSGRAKCKKCKNQIEKGALRIGTSKSKYGSPSKSRTNLYPPVDLCVTNPVSNAYYVVPSSSNIHLSGSMGPNDIPMTK